MHKHATHNQIKVVWEAVPNPDPHDLLKAVAMLFGRRVSLSTAPDLTSDDDELLCEQPQDP
jgi:hypothetical protein